MTNEEILRVAVTQQAYDMACRPEDFLGQEHVVTISRPHPQARRYLDLPFFCNFATYGGGIVASVDERVKDFVSKYLADAARSGDHAFEIFQTPRLHLLTEEFARYGKLSCFMAEYFLPDVNLLRELPCRYEIRILTPQDFADLYLPEWSNALCEKRRHLDMLAAGAYDGDKLIGMAGCSADCDTMWQIGIDVLPEYRRQGIASALTSRLALEILARDKVPFYCCSWANIRSARNAIHSGFRPAWVEFTAIDAAKAAFWMK